MQKNDLLEFTHRYKNAHNTRHASRPQVVHSLKSPLDFYPLGSLIHAFLLSNGDPLIPIASWIEFKISIFLTIKNSVNKVSYFRNSLK